VTISVVNVHAHIAPHGMWSVILKNASALHVCFPPSRTSPARALGMSACGTEQ
jgi:hypothetical protein